MFSLSTFEVPISAYRITVINTSYLQATRRDITIYDKTYEINRSNQIHRQDHLLRINFVTNSFNRRDTYGIYFILIKIITIRYVKMRGKRR